MIPAQAVAVGSPNRDAQTSCGEYATACLVLAIALRRTQGFDAARSMIIANNGKIVMDAIRRIVAQMSATERTLLETRTARVAGDERNIVIVAFIGATLSIITRLAIAFFVQRWQAGRAHARQQTVDDSVPTDPGPAGVSSR